MLDDGDAVEFANLSGTFAVNNPVEITIDGEPFILVPGPAAMPVTVVIKPGSADVHINRCSKGVTTVALLGSASFDVRDINTDTLAFGQYSDPATTPSVRPMRVKSNEDIDGDSIPNAILQVKTAALAYDGLVVDDALLYVTGKLFNGTPFRGFDEVYLANRRNCK